MTHTSKLLGTTLALGAAMVMVGAGAADAASRKARPRVASHRAYHRYIAYDRAPRGGYGYGYGYGYGAYPVAVPAYGGLFGGYPTVDQQYGYPPGGIVAQHTYENQLNAGLASELDQTAKQTATGGPVGGPLNGGSGR